MPAEYSTKIFLAKAFVSTLVVGAGLFALGGTFDWPAAWLYLGLSFAWSTLTVPWLRKHNPELLEKRLLAATSPGFVWDKAYIQINLLLYVVMMATVAIDAARFKYSSVPLALTIPAFAGVVAAYALIFYTLKVNRYAIKTVEVQTGQTVIRTGPYSVVRHPMYAAVILLYISTPPALGSFYGLLPAAAMAMAVMVRSYLEEKVLRKDLAGYEEYTRVVRYRVIPGLW